MWEEVSGNPGCRPDRDSQTGEAPKEKTLEGGQEILLRCNGYPVLRQEAHEQENPSCGRVQRGTTDCSGANLEGSASYQTPGPSVAHLLSLQTTFELERCLIGSFLPTRSGVTMIF